MKSSALAGLLFCTTAVLVAARASESDTRLSGTPDQRADLALIAKPGSTSPSNEASEVAKLAVEQRLVRTQLAGVEAKIRDLNTQRERLEARQKELIKQLLIAHP